MSVFVLICFGVAAILGALGAVNRPAPAPFGFVAAAVAFVALGLLLQGLAGVTG